MDQQRGNVAEERRKAERGILEMYCDAAVIGAETFVTVLVNLPDLDDETKERIRFMGRSFVAAQKRETLRKMEELGL